MDMAVILKNNTFVEIDKIAIKIETTRSFKIEFFDIQMYYIKTRFGIMLCQSLHLVS